MSVQDTNPFDLSNRKGNWRRDPGNASLAEVNRSIALPAGSWRRFAAFLGPGYMVAVGYMDPGNWATSIAGGSKFGYTLLIVALISNLMAIVLQALCARLAIASGRDLAQACRDAFPRWVAIPLWLMAELAIIATDIAEVIGTAIGLNLLFGIPLEIGVIITALDVFLILWLQNKGFRWLEAFIITLLGVIAVCFGLQIALADPDWGGVIRGFAPTVEILRNPEMLYLALGILGATVMPHNLYLHSAIVQTRDYGDSLPEKRQALKFATLDSTIALMFALFINASILILAAASFNATGRTEVVELGDAHQLLGPLLGVIAVCFGLQIALADPDWGGVIRGFAPTVEILRNPEMLYLALGILGATVMPHNLYLHSAIVQTRDYGHSLPEKRQALKFATLDSTIALMFALFINASILILAAASFHATGRTEVVELGDAHQLIGPLLGSGIAPSLFAIALLACGLNSTVTATLAGQVVMEGFLNLRIPPWARRLITRGIAIIPAAAVTIYYGSAGTGQLLILTQVVLSLQLSFAVVPLVMFTASRKKMGPMVAPLWLIAIAVLIAVVIIALNLKLLVDFVGGGL